MVNAIGREKDKIGNRRGTEDGEHPTHLVKKVNKKRHETIAEYALVKLN